MPEDAELVRAGMLAHRPASAWRSRRYMGRVLPSSRHGRSRGTLAASGSCMLAPGRCHDEGHRDQHRRLRGILLGGSARADAQPSPARGARGRRVPDGGGVPIDDVADPREPRHRRPPRATRRGRQPHPEPADGPGGGPDRRSDPRRAALLRVPTIYDRAHDAGLKTAAVDWPATRHATSLDWNLPFFKDQRVFESQTAPASGPSSARSASPWTARANGRSSRSGS